MKKNMEHFLHLNPILGGYPAPPILGGGVGKFAHPYYFVNKSAMCVIFGMNIKYDIKFYKKSKKSEKSDDVSIFPGKTGQNHVFCMEKRIKM